MQNIGQEVQESEHEAQGCSSKINCQTLAVALQDLSNSIQELAADPCSFVLHRTQCCSLAKSYTLTVQHVAHQLQLLSQGSASVSEYLHQRLRPSLSELHHAMLQGRNFIRDCLYGDGWVKKAVVLALSTEAQDVCLHDLVWCLCVIQQAMGHIVLGREELENSIYSSLNAVWAETCQNQDMDVVLKALRDDIACWEHQLLSRKNLSSIIQKDTDAQCCLAKFLYEKLSREYSLDDKEAPRVDALPWASHHEFSIKDIVGQGGFAAVYEVEWHGETYGQKMFCGVDKSIFVKEAAIQATLRHPNLLQLICCTSRPSKKRYSLVMELMDMDLRSRIDDRVKDGFNPPFPLLTCVDIMLQIGKGMEHLHSLNIMHRDLKSANLLISDEMSTDETSNDCRMRVKIADFGMSKAKHHSSNYSTPHAGTTYWRAPEVFDVNPDGEFVGQSTAKYTKKADVYSFAMVCYEIFSGKVPFADGGKCKDLHQRLLNGERPELPSSCPAYLVSYINKCWHGDPVQRPTFAQISRTLRHLKGVLLTSTADPRTPLTQIEEKLQKKMGSQWPSMGPKWSSTQTMTISFQMSWYKVMEHTLTQKEAEKAAQTLSVQKAKTFSSVCSVAVSCSLCYNRMCSNLEHGVRVALNWCYLGLCCGESQMYCLEPSFSMSSEGYVAAKGFASRKRLKVFSYSELEQATGMFDMSVRLGVGGYSKVYKGILAGGKVVAVKDLAWSRRNIHFELDVVSKIRHPNIVPLLGFCNDRESRMLVYEFISRGDLGQWLYGKPQASVLSWAQRCRIACGVASALDYLHNGICPPIVHRDVKPSNILLDDDYNAFLSDFDTALQQGEGEREIVFAGAIGTPGYMAPEYMYTLQGGLGVDVYSFGVVLLQLVSGRQLYQDKMSVIDYVKGLQKNGRLVDAVDVRLRGDDYLDKEEEMIHLLRLGLRCCQDRQAIRVSMHDVVESFSSMRLFDGPPGTSHTITRTSQCAHFFAKFKDIVKCDC